MGNGLAVSTTSTSRSSWLSAALRAAQEARQREEGQSEACGWGETHMREMQSILGTLGTYSGRSAEAAPSWGCAQREGVSTCRVTC